MIDAFLVSTGVVAVAEMGDKTQLLALVLAARFRKPLPIVAGIFVSTMLNHFVAGWIGALLSGFLAPAILHWVAGIGFMALAAWVLIPDLFDETDNKIRPYGAFIGTTVAFLSGRNGR